MKKNIKITNLNFSYSKTKVFDNFNMEISTLNTAIIGTPASGKTTLAKILSGLYPTNEVTVMTNKLNKSNMLTLRKKFCVVLNDYEFVSETVINELVFGMENLCFEIKEIEKKTQEIVEFFELSSIINNNPNFLSNENKALIKILSFLLINPKLIIYDDLIMNLTINQKHKLFEYMNTNKIQHINITSNIDEVIFSDYLIVLDEGKIVLEGNVEAVLNEETILKRLGFNLPFIVDLSKQLISYDLINKIYFKEEELVEVLWK